MGLCRGIWGCAGIHGFLGLGLETQTGVISLCSFMFILLTDEILHHLGALNYCSS